MDWLPRVHEYACGHVVWCGCLMLVEVLMLMIVALLLTRAIDRYVGLDTIRIWLLTKRGERERLQRLADGTHPE